ncbi:hypothetical protein AB1Y20_015325 [Prymnesium parvum]|uniref:peptidylprolyl isomerase n=1 Tax=Prymnesium parvum TaxID=97485 RepID=A0AB34K159_PRYPA|mmetsp:Transcript_32431/g.67975  ORF Transcript_32431/g.67975 Transcript_32431/m.67975 type:complete len:591 (+) Transcript_32431:35-1807(+)
MRAVQPAVLGMLAFALSAHAYATTAACPAVRACSTRFASARCEGVTMSEAITCTPRKLPKSAVAIDINVPEKLSKDIHMKVIGELSKTASIPGFRKGKVPPAAVVSALGMKKVKSATIEQIIDVGLQQSGAQVQLQTIGEARLEEDIEKLEDRYRIGEAISFTVVVDVYPQVPLTEADYVGFSVSVQDVPFNQEAYDRALNKLRDQHATLVDVEEGVGAQMDNQLLVNMNGFFANADGSKGEALPQIAGGEGVTVRLQPGKFMYGLVEGLTGIKKGETRTISVTFPPRTSAPQLAGKQAVFEVECLELYRRELADVNDEFANKVKSGMTWAELDEKLREGVDNEVEEVKTKLVHQELQKAIVSILPDSFEVPETLLEQVAKERFAMMLSDMREQGATDDDLKDIITIENYERYKKISQAMNEAQVKGDFALKHIAQQQGLVITRNRVDEEVMALQRGALQRGEKFKESEVRPKVEAQLEKDMVLEWLRERATIRFVEPTEGSEDDVAELLGGSPEELAARVMAEEKAAAGKNAAPAASTPEASPVAEPPVETTNAESHVEAEAATKADDGASAKPPDPSAPDGFEWGATF